MTRYRNVKNRLPAIMSLLLASAIIMTAFFRSSRQGTLAIDRLLLPSSILAFLYLLWIALEARVAVAEPRKGNSASDEASLEFYAVSQAATVISALWYGPKLFTIPHAFGFVLFIVGVSLRLWAIHTLGRYYSHVVRVQDDHRIIGIGPYRFLRHPAYAGMIGSHFGIVIAFFNAVTLVVFLFGLVPAVLLRIHVEERVLYLVPGYAEFARTRKRLVPIIW